MIGCLLTILTVCLCFSVEEPMLLGAEEDLEEKPALVPSLFPFVPPTLYFSTASEKGQDCLCAKEPCDLHER